VTPKARPEGAKPKRAKSAKAPRCPICGKPAAEDYRPFCSKACADIDLGRWLGGRYVVPGERVAPPQGDEETED
jgi:endogenous inhibitor of DNA gyrase (YacG/DUF329 family)